jgi:large subunit ribosomal protein LP0
MGKNTLIKAGIKRHMTKPVATDADFEVRSKGWKPQPHLKIVHDLLQSNVGLIFCNNNLAEVNDVIKARRVPAPARVGALAPYDVYVPAGGTGLDPN